MLNTKPDPKFLTEDERAILDVFRGLKLSVASAAEALGRAARPDPAAEADGDTAGVEDLRIPPGSAARRLAMLTVHQARDDWRLAGERLATATALYDEAEGKGLSLDEADAFQRWLDAASWARSDAKERLMASILMVHGLAKEPINVGDVCLKFRPVSIGLDDDRRYVVFLTDDDAAVPDLVVVNEDDHTESSFRLDREAD